MSSKTITEVHRFSSTYFSQGDHPFGKRLSSPSLASIALTTTPTTNTNSDCDYETSSEGFHSPRGQHALPFSKFPNTPIAPLSSCCRTQDFWDRNLVPKFSSQPFVPCDDSPKILCRKFANVNSTKTLDHIGDTSKVKSLPEMGMNTWCTSRKFPNSNLLSTGHIFDPSHDSMELKGNIGDFTQKISTNLQMLSGSASVTESHYECDKKNDDTELRFTISNDSVVHCDGYQDKMENANSYSCIRGKRGTIPHRNSMEVDSSVEEETYDIKSPSNKRKKKYAVLSSKSQYFPKPHSTFNYYPISRIEGEFAPLQNKLSEIQGKVRALSLDYNMAYGDCAKNTSFLSNGTLDYFSCGNLENLENLKATRENVDGEFNSRKNCLNKKPYSARSFNDDQPLDSVICTNFSTKLEEPSKNIDLQKEDIKNEHKEHLETCGTKQTYQSEEISFLAALTILARKYSFLKNYPITHKDESLLSNDNLSRETSVNCSENMSTPNECNYKISTSTVDETEETWPKECTRGMRSYPYQ